MGSICVINSSPTVPSSCEGGREGGREREKEREEEREERRERERGRKYGTMSKHYRSSISPLH